MDENTFKIIIAVTSIATAIGTVGAVAIAIYLSFKQNKVNLNLKIFYKVPNIKGQPFTDFGECKKIFIHIYNKSLFRAELVDISLRCGLFSHRHTLFLKHFEENNLEIPIRIEPFSSIELVYSREKFLEFVKEYLLLGHLSKYFNFLKLEMVSNSGQVLKKIFHFLLNMKAISKKRYNTKLKATAPLPAAYKSYRQQVSGNVVIPEDYFKILVL